MSNLLKKSGHLTESCTLKFKYVKYEFEYLAKYDLLKVSWYSLNFKYVNASVSLST